MEPPWPAFEAQNFRCAELRGMPLGFAQEVGGAHETPLRRNDEAAGDGRRRPIGVVFLEPLHRQRHCVVGHLIDWHGFVVVERFAAAIQHQRRRRSALCYRCRRRTAA